MARAGAAKQTGRHRAAGSAPHPPFAGEGRKYPSQGSASQCKRSMDWVHWAVSVASHLPSMAHLGSFLSKNSK